MISLRPFYVFSLTLLAALLWQTFLWHTISLGDHVGWMQRIQALSQGQLQIFTLPTFANPDAAMLTVGALAHHLGASLPASLHGATALLNAIFTASAVTLVFLLYPGKIWWLPVATTLLFNDAYLESTPHDAILAPAIVSLVLLTLYLLKWPARKYMCLGIFGTITGVCLATFLPLSLILISPLIIFLAWQKRVDKKAVTILFVSTLLAWLIFDPLLYLMPIAHFKAMVGQLTIHSFAFANTPLPWAGFFSVAPFALLGLALASISLSSRPVGLPAHIPKAFLLFCVGWSCLVIIFLITAHYKTFRSFDPLIFTWEALWPLLILDIAKGHRIRPFLQTGLFLLVTIAPLLDFLIAYSKYLPPLYSL